MLFLIRAGQWLAEWEAEVVLVMMIIIRIIVMIASSTEAAIIADAPRLSSTAREACTICTANILRQAFPTPKSPRKGLYCLR